MSPTFNVAGVLVPLDEEPREYRDARRRYFVALMRQHPDVWRMHKANRQFVRIEGVIARKAVQHCAVQLARARVLGRLLGLDLVYQGVLQKAAFLHDSYKGHETRHLNRSGRTWKAYDWAQLQARVSWDDTGIFSQVVMRVASAVAHESLVEMLAILDGAAAEGVSQEELAMLAMHFLDDAAIEDEWAVPVTAAGVDVIAARMARNAANERYWLINEAGCTELRKMAAAHGYDYFQDGETTYEAQLRVGHLVEDELARIIMHKQGVTFNPRDLPVIIDNVIRRELTQLMAAIEREKRSVGIRRR